MAWRCNMKKFILLMALGIVLSWTQIGAQAAPSQTKLEISFTFKRQSGFSSNQFALWIEDSRGRLVKTLYATKFTANGGWAKRPQSIPLWVVKSGISAGVSALSKNDIDAFTGATPRAGALSYSWDGAGMDGNPMAPGEYRVFLEATLREGNRLLCSAPFTLGSGSAGSFAEARLNMEYYGNSTKEHDMIENVKVMYRP